MRQAAQGSAAGQIGRAGERARPRAADQEAERARIAAEHLAGEDRHHMLVGRGGHAYRRHQQQQAPAWEKAEGVAKALFQLLEPVRVRGMRSGGFHAHHQQGDDQRQVGQRVEHEAPGLAGKGEHAAGDGRSDEARAVHDQRIERDRVGQVFLALDHFQQESAAARIGESVDRAEEQRDRKDVPHLDQAGEGERGEQQGLRQRQRLREHQQLAPVVAVHPHAGKRRHQQDRNLQGESGHAEHECGAGDAVHQPGDGDVLHPGAYHRQ